MSKKYENIFYLVLFFFISILVFLSRQIQINYIKKFSNKFYIFNDPVLVNPDGYHHLSNIKNNLISHSNLLEKFFNENFLTSIYIFLFSIFDNPNLPELVMISSPYMVILAFFSIFIFFYSFSGKKIALLTSFTFTISTIFFARSSVLFFDTDTLNIFFTFFILFTLSLYFRSNLSRTNFFFISILFILSNYVFIFHYPKTIFSIIFIVLLCLVFFNIKQKNIDKILVLLLFLSVVFVSYGSTDIFNSLFGTHTIYSNGQTIEEGNLINVSSTVIELKSYSLLELEKILFRFKFYGLGLFASIFGLLFFVKKDFKQAILLIPFIIFSYLTMSVGIRFLIYVGPFIYFGFFYFCYFLINSINEKFKLSSNNFENISYLTLIFIIWKVSLASCVGLFSLDCKQKFSIKPYFDKQLVKGIIKFNNLDHDYNIITSLDYGYLINYYTNSKSVINPGAAFNINKYRLFYSQEKISNNFIKNEFNISNDHQNYIFLTKDFVKWWPTISKLYSKKDDKISQILVFNCKQNTNNELKCISEQGITSLINLSTGHIDGSKIIYKTIINSKNSHSEKIIDKNGSVILVYSPNLKYNNLYAIFPMEYENLVFIKYFFSKINNSEIELFDDGWPNYRVYRVNN
ncbi:hypothetical protein OAS12_04265 [Candidatus Pelagibacter ubique]|nr:hypothetical protein [Candidatus Pelagibacter ubique]